LQAIEDEGVTSWIMPYIQATGPSSYTLSSAQTRHAISLAGSGGTTLYPSDFVVPAALQQAIPGALPAFYQPGALYAAHFNFLSASAAYADKLASRGLVSAPQPLDKHPHLLRVQQNQSGNGNNGQSGPSMTNTSPGATVAAGGATVAAGGAVIAAAGSSAVATTVTAVAGAEAVTTVVVAVTTLGVGVVAVGCVIGLIGIAEMFMD
jgi:hypothetical protein